MSDYTYFITISLLIIVGFLSSTFFIKRKNLIRYYRRIYFCCGYDKPLPSMERSQYSIVIDTIKKYDVSRINSILYLFLDEKHRFTEEELFPESNIMLEYRKWLLYVFFEDNLDIRSMIKGLKMTYYKKSLKKNIYPLFDKKSNYKRALFLIQTLTLFLSPLFEEYHPWTLCNTALRDDRGNKTTEAIACEKLYYACSKFHNMLNSKEFELKYITL